MTPHPQAEILRAIADGKTIERFVRPLNVWLEAGVKCVGNYPQGTFRIKPETMSINGHEFPEPVREPLGKGQEYWVVCIDRQEDALAVSYTWRDDEVDAMWMKRGLIQLTEEGAIAQAKAMIAAAGGEV